MVIRQTTIELFFVKASMGTSFLDLLTDCTNLLTTNSLIKSTWHFLLEQHILLQHDISYPPQTEYNKILMQEFLAKGAMLAEMSALNNYRLFLQAYYLSDLMDGFIMFIKDNVWNG